MKKNPAEKISKPQISLPRKILVWLFIILFWVYFYWFRTNTAPPPQNSPEIQHPDPPQN